MKTLPKAKHEEHAHRLSLTRSGVLLAIMTVLLFLPAYFLSVALLFLMGSMLMALLLFNFLVVNGRLNRVSLSWVAVDELFAGQEGEAVLQLSSEGPFRKLRNLQLQLIAAEVIAREVMVDRLERAPQQIKLRLSADLRGWHTLSACTLRLSYPFGLFQVVRRLPLQERLLVYPALVVRPRGPLLAERESQNLLPAGGDDFVYLAAYQQGEDVRRIHWKKSTLSELPVVKKDLSQLEVVTPHMLVPDACPHFEEALSLLATHFNGLNFSTDWEVLTSMGLVRVTTREEMLGQLAVAEPLNPEVADPYLEMGYDLLLLSSIKPMAPH